MALIQRVIILLRLVLIVMLRVCILFLILLLHMQVANITKK